MFLWELQADQQDFEEAEGGNNAFTPTFTLFPEAEIDGPWLSRGVVTFRRFNDPSPEFWAVPFP